MVEIYAVKVPAKIEKCLLTEVFEMFENDRSERIKRFRFKEDVYRATISDMLSRYLICTKLKVKLNKLAFERNKYGKPFLKDESIYFNSSHSGKWVICGLSYDKIGVDVESTRDIDFSIAKRFFHCNEYNEFNKKNYDQKLDFFFELWTLKESFIKADGRGLSLGLNSFEIIFIKNNIYAKYLDILTQYNLKLYDFEERYKLAVCAKENDFSNSISFIEFKFLAKNFLNL
ncbi:MAG: 4'-phosphopantetheinyl transferase superfamily protein [Clostridiales bacterium]